MSLCMVAKEFGVILGTLGNRDTIRFCIFGKVNQAAQVEMDSRKEKWAKKTSYGD